MSTIVFAIADSISHYNASYKIANALRNAGHRIIYIGDSKKRQKEVESQGYQFETIYGEFFNSFEKTGKKGLVNRVKNFYHHFKNLQRYKKALMEGTEIAAIIQKFNPEAFIIDVFHVIHAISLRRFGVKTIMLQTYVATDQDALVPPLNSDFIPGDDDKSRKRVKQLWSRLLLRRAFFNLVYQVTFAGLDKNSMVHAVINATGYPEKAINFKRSFHPGLTDIPELILSATEFDFKRQRKLNQHYVGPMVEMNRRDVLYDERYLEVLLEKELSYSEERNARPLIYCSLGTLNLNWYSKPEEFFSMVIDAFKSRPDYEVYIAVGSDIKPSVFKRVPENVKLFQFVPQIDILEHASVMITHGGINSINECILSGVPMIVYPLSKQVDQPGNAARVVFHGMGIRGDIRKETREGLLEKVDKILAGDVYKQRVNRMRETYASYGDVSKAVSVIENYLAAELAIA
ncbi:glycosyltransferase family 1 protein [Mucilaginibacter sp. 21P]|uniref:glycosyltransferase n=1 Tax=Mucilaginibacter sp. 21P TaxID=2778902 RepID=UPI001C5A30AD|nr:glycosyltransferase [Mucilaginibacter sp. 21P]QXV63892.1 glycosyltransferase family 1 protein [Mucilaginibacter sp. 21P]